MAPHKEAEEEEADEEEEEEADEEGVSGTLSVAAKHGKVGCNGDVETFLLISSTMPWRAASLANARCSGESMFSTTPAGSVGPWSKRFDANFFLKMLPTARFNVAFASSSSRGGWYA